MGNGQGDRYLERIAQSRRKGLPVRLKISPAPGAPPRDAELIEIEKSTENWNEYTLADGTILRVKPVLLEVWRILDEYDPDGNPQYVLKTAALPVVRSPEALKKKVQ
jgi:hypothetical protein